MPNANAGAWVAGAAGVAGIAVLIGGGLYYLTREPEEPKRVNQSSSSSDSDSDTARNPDTVSQVPAKRSDTARNPEPVTDTVSQVPAKREDDSNRTTSGLVDRVNIANENRAIPDPEITNPNSIITDIYERYIAPRHEDFKLNYKIFDKIFQHLHRNMRNVDRYYERYSSPVSFDESHNDRLNVKNPDELTMDVVIELPLDISDDPNVPCDIKFEPRDAEFVELKMGVQYQKLFGNDSFMINKTAYKWRDDDDYLTSSKFIDWFESVVVKALNRFETNARGVPVVQVDGLTYSINRAESGPAITLTIKDESSDFRIDVNLVPALRFPETRWPINMHYRQIPEVCKRNYWLIVPKPYKEGSSEVSRRRSWILALHYQERELMRNCTNLRQAVRLLKRLCEVQKMDKISSYCIETLFLWEVDRRKGPRFWKLSPANLFRLMVERLHYALVSGRLDYFWNEDNNLLAGISMTELALYTIKLRNLLDLFSVQFVRENYRYKSVAKFLLTPEEFEDYNTKFLHI